MPMVSLKLMAGEARSTVVASASDDGRRMSMPSLCEPMKREPRRTHDRSAGLFLVRFGIELSCRPSNVSRIKKTYYNETA